MIRYFILPLLAIAPFSAFAADSSRDLQVNASGTNLTVRFKGQTVLTYNFSPAQFKPYIAELHPLGLDNILLDAPPDHLHHHGIMYGIKVNGINYWEEVTNAGFEIPKLMTTNDSGVSSAEFVQAIAWAPERKTSDPVLVETRTIGVSVNESEKEVRVQWHSHFRTGKSKVVLSGSNYHGLGVRFNHEFDGVALQLNASGRPDLSGTKQDVSKAAWAGVILAKENAPATLLIWGAPSNNRGESQFFSMLRPFAYLSATQGLDREPLEYGPGEEFDLTYTIVVYPEAKSPEFLANRATK